MQKWKFYVLLHTAGGKKKNSFKEDSAESEEMEKPLVCEVAYL